MRLWSISKMMILLYSSSSDTNNSLGDGPAPDTTLLPDGTTSEGKEYGTTKRTRIEDTTTNNSIHNLPKSLNRCLMSLQKYMHSIITTSKMNWQDDDGGSGDGATEKQQHTNDTLDLLIRLSWYIALSFLKSLSYLAGVTTAYASAAGQAPQRGVYKLLLVVRGCDVGVGLFWGDGWIRMVLLTCECVWWWGWIC